MQCLSQAVSEVHFFYQKYRAQFGRCLQYDEFREPSADQQHHEGRSKISKWPKELDQGYKIFYIGWICVIDNFLYGVCQRNDMQINIRSHKMQIKCLSPAVSEVHFLYQKCRAQFERCLQYDEFREPSADQQYHEGASKMT